LRKMTNHYDLICASLPRSGEERAAGRLAGLHVRLRPSGQAPGGEAVAWLLSCVGRGVADGQPDGPVAEVGHEVQPAAEGLDIADDDLEGSDLAVLDLDTRATLTSMAAAICFWPRPSCLRVSASWCPRVWASSWRAPASISVRKTPAACSSRSRSSQSRGVRLGMAGYSCFSAVYSRYNRSAIRMFSGTSAASSRPCRRRAVAAPTGRDRTRRAHPDLGPVSGAGPQLLEVMDSAALELGQPAGSLTRAYRGMIQAGLAYPGMQGRGTIPVCYPDSPAPYAGRRLGQQ